MSSWGLAEAARWDADFLRVFGGTDLRPALVTDDATSFTTPGGFPSTFNFAGFAPDGRERYQMLPDAVPGRAVWYHERKHGIDAQVALHVPADYLDAWVSELFRIRGAQRPTNGQLAIEQGASMLPEAFVGEWGGYIHPIWGLNPDPLRVLEYAQTDTARQVREFLRGFRSWWPSQAIIASVPVMVTRSAAPSASWWGPLPLTNYRVGRRAPIDTLIFHHIHGTIWGADQRFKTYGQGASTQYGVPADDDMGIVQWVSEADTAYGAAGVPPQVAWDALINDRAIQVEVECFGTIPCTLNDSQYARCADIARGAHQSYGVPYDRLHMIGHREVAGVATACPGQIDVDRIVSMARAAEEGWLDVDEQTLRRIIREEATQPLSTKLDAGFNVTAVALLRRTARWIVWAITNGAKGAPRDPAGQVTPAGHVPYPDDGTPLG